MSGLVASNCAYISKPESWISMKSTGLPQSWNSFWYMYGSAEANPCCTRVPSAMNRAGDPSYEASTWSSDTQPLPSR